jgi:hypothetical protein
MTPWGKVAILGRRFCKQIAFEFELKPLLARPFRLPCRLYTVVFLDLQFHISGFHQPQIKKYSEKKCTCVALFADFFLSLSPKQYRLATIYIVSALY